MAAAAVPKQAQLHMVHDTKSCSSSAYSNFRKTSVYNDDKSSPSAWRSTYRGSFVDMFADNGGDEGDVTVDVSRISDLQVQSLKDNLKSKFEKRGAGISRKRAMAQKGTMLKLFQSVDADNSDAIDKMEFVKLMKMLGLDRSIKEIQSLFSEMDFDSNGKINFRETWRWYTTSWAHLFTGGAGDTH